MSTPDPTALMTPAERWGTCCPFDPACEHSLLDPDTDALERRMRTPLTDEQALNVAAGWGPEGDTP